LAACRLTQFSLLYPRALPSLFLGFLTFNVKVKLKNLAYHYGVRKARTTTIVTKPNDERHPVAAFRIVRPQVNICRQATHCKRLGDADYVPLFADDEFNEVGEPNYIEISRYYE
jgi:hypothetical protein